MKTEMNHFPEAVFFDCWDTLLVFQKKSPDWNTLPLKRHALKPDTVDWAKVDSCSEDFLHGYYRSRSLYEINALQYLTLLTRLFPIDLDCSLADCAREILSGLDPKPIPGADAFLSYLDQSGCFYAILSNTLYGEQESLDLVKSFYPQHAFQYYFGSADVGVKKPNPLFFQAGVALSGKDIHRCVYIGDTFFQDVNGAYQAGFGNVFWLNWKKQSLVNPQDQLLQKCVRHQEVASYDQLLACFQKGEAL
jgi:FMN phosphatase YigB (HAD superfamily)